MSEHDDGFVDLVRGLRRLGMTSADAFRCAAELKNAEQPLGPVLYAWNLPGFVWPPRAS